MHETSLMQSLMHHITVAAAEEGARRVVGVSVWLGALTGISAEHFIEHFNEAAVGTIAEGAMVEVALSDDAQHVNAQDILLQGIEVET